MIDQLPDNELERLYNAGLIPESQIAQLALDRIPPEDLVVIEAFAYGLAKLLNTPIDQLAAEAGMQGETMNDPTYGNPVVGSWLAFLLGLPAGALGGYFLRRWQEDHPGQVLPGLPNLQLAQPKTAGVVGGPWLDMEPVVSHGYTIGGPWVDVDATVVGASYGSDPAERRRLWPQTKSLIQSAINEVREIDRSQGAAAYVWTLDPAGQPSAFSRVTLEPLTGVISFNSVPEALDWMRERIQEPHIALALFDRHSSHWPNPTNWTKSNDPTYAEAIAMQAAKASPVRTSGTYVGQSGPAVDDVKARAQSLANKRAGQIVGVIHTAKDNLWHALAFHSIDDADDWFGTATHDPASFTYAAYYDKDDVQWPNPVNEKVGGTRAAPSRGALGARGVATTSGRWAR